MKWKIIGGILGVCGDSRLATRGDPDYPGDAYGDANGVQIRVWVTSSARVCYVDDHDVIFANGAPVQLEDLAQFACSDAERAAYLRLELVRDYIGFEIDINDASKTLERARAGLARVQGKIEANGFAAVSDQDREDYRAWVETLPYIRT